MTLSPESKGTVFNSKELTKMEALYTRIHYLEAQGFAISGTSFSGFSFSAEVVDNLIRDIDIMSKSLE